MNLAISRAEGCKRGVTIAVPVASHDPIGPPTEGDSDRGGVGFMAGSECDRARSRMEETDLRRRRRCQNHR